MSFSIQYRYGASEVLDEVPDSTIRGLLGELDENVEDAEHGDVWVTDEVSGWTVGAFAGERRADGGLEAVRAEPWEPGYGS